MRLIASTPQARTTSAAPPATSEEARLVACWDEPHWLSTVVAAVVRGRPAVSQAVRAMLKDCLPTCDTHPPTTWSTAAGSIPERSMAAAWTAPSNSAGGMVDRSPPRRPIGLRTASTITPSDRAASLIAASEEGPGEQQQDGRPDEGDEDRPQPEVGDAATAGGVEDHAAEEPADDADEDG